ncbi:MAG: hypothetical protein JSS79_05215 [Bacteroidetes bacterium]|nr:hypothetical protein [Bacteroidota bacterium]
MKGLFTNNGAMVVYGCNVSFVGGLYNISSGLIFCDDNFLSFNGVTGVSLPYYLYSAAPVLQEYLPYEDGVSRATRQFYGATGGDTIPGSGQYVTITTGGGRSWQQSQSAWVFVTGTQTVGGNKTFTGNGTFSGANNFTNSNTFSGAFSVNANGNVNLTGGGTLTVSGATTLGNTLSMTGHGIINLSNGVSAQDAATFGQLSAVSSALSTETTNRINADATINTGLNNEISNRTVITDSLQSQVTTEVTNRTNADTALQNSINSESAARSSADTTLQNNINFEASTRSAADAVLTAQITPLNGYMNYCPHDLGASFYYLRSTNTANDITLNGTGGFITTAFSGDPNFFPKITITFIVQENDNNGVNTVYLYRNNTTLVAYRSINHNSNGARISHTFTFCDTNYPTSGSNINYKTSFDGNNTSQYSGYSASVNWYFSKPSFEVQWVRRTPSPVTGS